MEFLKDISIGITIAVILYVFILSITTIMTNNETISEKTQKVFIWNFIAGISLIFMGNTVFNNTNGIKNNAMRYGAILGGCGLMVNSIIMNWDYLSDTTRVVLFGLLLMVIIAYSYRKKNVIKENSTVVHKL
jgi:hypothetical protein